MKQPENLGERVSRHRKAAGMSAQALADKIGATRAVINNLESGRRGDLTLGQLVLIADALEVPAFSLAADLRHPFAPSGYGDLTNWDVVQVLNSAWDLPHPDAEVVRETVYLVDVVERWGSLAAEYAERAEAALASDDPRDRSLAVYSKQILERALARGHSSYASLEADGVDVSWARGDWMHYEVPDYGFDQATS